jgi:NAD(P)-dependent dehydrogenase (short-subunit alcohol dehydrogenase family)
MASGYRFERAEKKGNIVFELTNKVAVITGATSGIGEATARRFAAAGARIVIAGRRDARGLADELGGLYVQTDVRREEQVEALLVAAVDRYGKLDIVVNNAGAATGKEIGGISEAEFDQTMDTSGKGVLWGIKHAAPRMVDGGSIINTSSYAGIAGFPTLGAYAAAKHAVVGLSRTAALELAPRGIRVNVVCPGTIDTPILDDPSGKMELIISRQLLPLGRVGQAREVAALIHFLASDDSGFITGAVIPIDGGVSAGIGPGVIESLLTTAGVGART